MWKMLYNDGTLANKGRLCSMIYELIIKGVCEMEAKAKKRVRNEFFLQTIIDLAEDLKLFASDWGLDAMSRLSSSMGDICKPP